MNAISKDIIKPYYTKMVAVDIESSGVKPWKNGIIQIAAAVYDLDGNKKETFNEYMYPGNDVVYDDAALKINGLTLDFIEKQRPIKQVLIEFVAFMDKHLTLSNPNAKSEIIGNNFAFDKYFLDFAFDKHVPELNKYTKWMFRRLFDLKGLVRVTMPNIKHISQDNLGKLLNIPNEHAHDAMGDVDQMMKIFFTLQEINERRIMLDILENPLIGS